MINSRHSSHYWSWGNER